MTAVCAASDKIPATTGFSESFTTLTAVRLGSETFPAASIAYTDTITGVNSVTFGSEICVLNVPFVPTSAPFSSTVPTTIRTRPASPLGSVTVPATVNRACSRCDVPAVKLLTVMAGELADPVGTSGTAVNGEPTVSARVFDINSSPEASFNRTATETLAPSDLPTISAATAMNGNASPP